MTTGYTFEVDGIIAAVKNGTDTDLQDALARLDTLDPHSLMEELFAHVQCAAYGKDVNKTVQSSGLLLHHAEQIVEAINNQDTELVVELTGGDYSEVVAYLALLIAALETGA